MWLHVGRLGDSPISGVGKQAVLGRCAKPAECGALARWFGNSLKEQDKVAETVVASAIT